MAERCLLAPAATLERLDRRVGLVSLLAPRSSLPPEVDLNEWDPALRLGSSCRGGSVRRRRVIACSRN